MQWVLKWAICKQIIGEEGDYIISLKNNQANIFEDVKVYFQDDETLEKSLCFRECAKAHGRIEQRSAWSTDDVNWLQEQCKWPGLQSIGIVTSKVSEGGKEIEETRLYISSLLANESSCSFTLEYRK